MEHPIGEFKIKTDIQIRFNDIDGLGHVNNATYAEYFDQGRMHYFNALNKDKPVDWKDARLIIASTHTDFQYPIFIDDKVEVLTRIHKLGNKSLKMFQYLIEKGSGDIKATCKSVMVGFDPKSNKAIVLPDKWREAISSFEAI